MRFLKRWKLKRSGFRPIAVFQPSILQQRLLLVHRKPSTVLKNIQQVQHQHTHTSYSMKLSVIKQETLPITFITMPQTIGMQPMKNKLVLQRSIISKQYLQDISDQLLQNSIRKEQEFYKYHPALAQKLANDLFESSALYQGMHRKTHKPMTQPAFFQLLPQRVIQQIPLQQKFQPAKKMKTESQIVEEKQELRIIELLQIVKEVYAQIETFKRRSERRKGRM